VSNKAIEDGHEVTQEELYGMLDSYIDDLKVQEHDPRKKGVLIQVLHKAQSLFGYLPDTVQKHVAKKMYLQHAAVSGVVSFYNFFTTTPKGKNSINICMGTACYVKGADKVLEEFERELGIKSGEVSADGHFSLDILRCVGACGLAPVVMVNEKVYGRVTTKDVKKIVAEYKMEATQDA
jgi:NADH:ubiquinone oxidoreductase subunit E